MDIWTILLIVAAGVAALFLLGIGITFVVGMFFVRLAVGRKKAWDNSLIPRAEREQPKKYPQRQKIIEQNQARIRGRTASCWPKPERRTGRSTPRTGFPWWPRPTGRTAIGG